jgi:hypothetical protein
MQIATLFFFWDRGIVLLLDTATKRFFQFGHGRAAHSQVLLDQQCFFPCQRRSCKNGQGSVARRIVTKRQIVASRLRLLLLLRGPPNTGCGNRLQGISKGCPLAALSLMKLLVDGSRESKRVWQKGEDGLQETLAFEHRFFRLGGRTKFDALVSHTQNIGAWVLCTDTTEYGAVQ